MVRITKAQFVEASSWQKKKNKPQNPKNPPKTPNQNKTQNTTKKTQKKKKRKPTQLGLPLYLQEKQASLTKSVHT